SAGAEVGQQPLQGQAGVDDVFDDQDVAPGDVAGEVLEDAHHAGGLGARAVGGDRHPVHLDLEVDLTCEVRHHHHRAAQHADQDRRLVRIVLGDLPSDLGEPIADLLLVQQHAVDV